MFYLKFPSKKNIVGFDKFHWEQVAKNEVLASKIYQLAKVNVHDIFLIRDNNNYLGTASLMNSTFQDLSSILNQKPYAIDEFINIKGVQEGLIIDSLLANWDV